MRSPCVDCGGIVVDSGGHTRQSRQRGLLAACVPAAVLASVLLAHAEGASAQRVERRAQSPSGQASPSTSYMERTFAFPVDGACEFEFFVDSNEGNNWLRVRRDGAVVFEASGRNRAGRARVNIPQGSRVLRVSYEKSATGSGTSELAWVDNLRCGGGSLNASFRFDEPILQAPNGWQAGGATGGWEIALHDAARSLRRPAGGAFTGYQPGGVRTASERTISWPSTGQPSQRNTVLIGYAVDSEQDHDFFKVFVDGSEKLSVSGVQRSGKVEIDVGAAGPHVIRLEYVKDESVDEGLDDARVLQLAARIDAATFEVGAFDGLSVGSYPADWQASAGASDGWVVGAGIEPRLYVTPETPSAEPVADGLRDDAYDRGTRVRFLQRGSMTAQAHGQARAVLSSSTQAFSLLLGAPARTNSAGGEQGQITVYLDAERIKTLRGQGCGQLGATPGAEDRRIRITYDWPNAGAAPTVNVGQDTGTCSQSTPWQTAQGGEELAVTVGVGESDDDPGFVHLEIRVVLPVASMLEQGVFGLAVETETRSSTVFQLPAFDTNRILADDVSSWESVYLGFTTPRATLPRYAVLDANPKHTVEEP